MTLGDMIRAHGPLGADEAALIGVQLCRRLLRPTAQAPAPGSLDPDRIVRDPDGQLTVLKPESPDSNEQPTIQDLGRLLFYLVSGTATTAATRLRDIRPDLPERFIHVVDRALLHNGSRSTVSAGSIEIELLQAIGRSDAGVSAPPDSRGWLIAATTVVAVAIAAYGVVLRTEGRATPDVERFVVPVPGHLTVPHGPGSRAFALSPDGSRLVFSQMDVFQTSARLFIKRMDEFDAQQIAPRGGQPFFSPDGSRLGFHTNSLMTMSLPAGEPVALGAAQSAGGASWATDGTIVYSNGRDLFRIPESGGVPVLLTRYQPNHANDERAIRPFVLPTGDVLFTLRTHAGTTSQINLLRRDGAVEPLVENATSAKYLPQGYLVYVAGDPPWITVAPFDIDRLAISGPAVQVEPLRSRTHWFDVSPSGTLAFSVPEQPLPQNAPRVVWVDRATGQREPLKVPVVPGEFNSYSLRLSPDGRKIAFTRLPHPLLETVDMDTPGPLFIGDLNSGTVSTPVSSSPVHPLAWTRDGTRIAYRTSTGNIAIRRIDGASGEQLLMVAREGLSCSTGDWSPDGRVLLMGCNGDSGAEGHTDLMMLSFRSPEDVGRAPVVPTPYLIGTKGQGAPRFTDDGRWVIVSSNISGEGARSFARAFPGPGPVVSVSQGRSRFPIIRGDELLYLAEVPEAARFRTYPTFAFDPPRPVFDKFENLDNLNDGRLIFNVSPDGRRLLLLDIGNGTGGDYLTGVTVVLHWVDHVSQLMAAAVQNR